MKTLLTLLCSLCIIVTSTGQTDPNHPNILLILADDLGVDAFNGYQDNALKPVTPTLDSLRDAGVAFRNAWSSPQCAPTRAAIMSGKYGVKTGVIAVPGNLDPIHTSIFQAVASQTNNMYADAVIGKWHISNPIDFTHPAALGVDHFEGIFRGAPNPSYTNWDKVKAGINNTPAIESTETEYVTSHLTDIASNWVNSQTQPWLLWLAHSAPHTPYETSPDPTTYSQSPTNSNLQRSIAMIETMDYEINRLLASMPLAVRQNTTIIFAGDNGSGRQVVQNFPQNRAKGSLYQGGVHVPFIVAGKNVTRQGVWDDALVNVIDIYATVLELVGANLPGGIYNSHSFIDLLTGSSSSTRPFNYTEITGNNNGSGWTIRDHQYKLIQFDDGTQEFYDLLADSLEMTNLIPSLSSTQQTILNQLAAEGADIRSSWSCQDLIQNGLELGIDCGTSSCGLCAGSGPQIPCSYDSLIICADILVDTFAIAEDYILAAYKISSDNAVLQAQDCIVLAPGFQFDGHDLLIHIEDCLITGIDDANCHNFNGLSYDDIGCGVTPTIASQYNESSAGDIRVITSNGFPNHNYDFNQNNPNIPAPQNHNFNIDLTPTVAANITSVLGNTNRPARYFGVAINGVIFAPAPAQPFIFENTSTGEFNFDWIFEPTNNIGTGMQWVGLDCASAHTGPQGYHYHGNMYEYAETISPGLSTTTVPPADPLHIGWASDGFPILYRFGPDENNNLTLLQPSYSIKYGNRDGDGVSAPCGAYNGKYTRDYEYIDCSGDLDECNGVARTITLTTNLGIETFDYFYVITDAFPQVSRCMVGTPDPSFEN